MINFIFIENFDKMNNVVIKLKRCLYFREIINTQNFSYDEFNFFQ